MINKVLTLLTLSKFYSNNKMFFLVYVGYNILMSLNKCAFNGIGEKDKLAGFKTLNDFSVLCYL